MSLDRKSSTRPLLLKCHVGFGGASFGAVNSREELGMAKLRTVTSIHFLLILSQIPPELS